MILNIFVTPLSLKYIMNKINYTLLTFMNVIAIWSDTLVYLYFSTLMSHLPVICVVEYNIRMFVLFEPIWRSWRSLLVDVISPSQVPPGLEPKAKYL